MALEARSVVEEGRAKLAEMSGKRSKVIWRRRRRRGKGEEE